MKKIYRALAIFLLAIALLICVVMIKFFTLGKKLDTEDISQYLYNSGTYRDSSEAKISFMGTSCFVFENNKEAIMIDPFFSNPSLLHPEREYKWEDFLSPNIIQKINLIAISHGHYDHCYDMPTLLPLCAEDTKIVGDVGIYYQLHSVIESHDFIKLSRDTSIWLYSKDSSFRVKAFPTEHLPHLGRMEFFAGTYIQPLQEMPSSLYRWKKCACYNYMIDILHNNTPVKRCVLVGGIITDNILQSMTREHNNFPITMLLHIMWKTSLNTPQIEKLCKLWHPDDVLLFHWNNFFSPLHSPLQYFSTAELPTTLHSLQEQGIRASVMLPFTSAQIR